MPCGFNRICETDFLPKDPDTEKDELTTYNDMETIKDIDEDSGEYQLSGREVAIANRLLH